MGFTFESRCYMLWSSNLLLGYGVSTKFVRVVSNSGDSTLMWPGFLKLVPAGKGPIIVLLPSLVSLVRRGSFVLTLERWEDGELRALRYLLGFKFFSSFVRIEGSLSSKVNPSSKICSSLLSCKSNDLLMSGSRKSVRLSMYSLTRFIC